MNQRHIALLKNLWHSPTWEALISLRDEMIVNWQQQLGTGETEFKYLQSCLLKDGKIEGVNALLNSIEILNSREKK